MQDVDVFTSAGDRVQSFSEASVRRLPDDGLTGPGNQCLMVCTSDYMFMIPPHHCMHGNFSNQNYHFSEDLATRYPLPTGRYVIVPSERRQQDCMPIRENIVVPKGALSFEVKDE